MAYKNIEDRRRYTREHSQQMRQHYRMLALVHYSQDPPSCKCCGETELVFLTIDHVDGGGRQHRIDNGIHGGVRTLPYWLVTNRYPAGFQVLCWNCNAAKHLLGECPHDRRNPDL